MFTEDELLPLSGLQHLAYCPRQFALIHLEQIWAENRYTAEGNLLHRHTDATEADTRGTIHTARTLRLRSLRLGLAGIADVVEFHRTTQGAEIPKMSARWQPYPVEYKRGRPKRNDCDEVQLCAQALCLEEMLGVPVPQGALFYGKTRRRKTIQIATDLRQRTETLATEMHRLWSERITPVVEYGRKCDQCSLLDRCMPNTCNQDIKRYLDWIGEEEDPA